MDDETRRSDRGIHAGNYMSEETGTAASTIIESTNTEWTNEKHSLYLNFMEESFVNQLYSHDYCLNEPHCQLSITWNDKHSSGSNKNSIYSGQFKVQRRGRWEGIKFERTQTRTQTDTKDELRPLLANPWIKHFRSPTTGRGCDETCDGTISNSDQLASSTNLHLHNSVGSTIEVSDQNFVDDAWEVEKKKNRAGRKKRLNAAYNTAGMNEMWGEPLKISNRSMRQANALLNILATEGTPFIRFIDAETNI